MHHYHHFEPLPRMSVSIFSLPRFLRRRCSSLAVRLSITVSHGGVNYIEPTLLNCTYNLRLCLKISEQIHRILKLSGNISSLFSMMVYKREVNQGSFMDRSQWLFQASQCFPFDLKAQLRKEQIITNKLDCIFRFVHLPHIRQQVVVCRLNSEILLHTNISVRRNEICKEDLQLQVQLFHPSFLRENIPFATGFCDKQCEYPQLLNSNV